MTTFVAASSDNASYVATIAGGDLPDTVTGSFDGYSISVKVAAITDFAATGDYEYGCLNKPTLGALCFGAVDVD